MCYNIDMDYIYLDEKKLVENLSYWQKIAEKNGASLNVVTKFCLSESKYIDILIKNGVNVISDSNMQNLWNIPESIRNNLQCCVIKTRLSDIKKYAQMCVPDKKSAENYISVSEKDFSATGTNPCENQYTPLLTKPIRFYLSDENCLKEIKKIPAEYRPQVVLIMECGDYKDGLSQNDIKSLVTEYCDLPIIGVSANFACLSGKMPDMESLNMLSETALYIQKIRKLEKPFVSVGGTVMHDMLESEKIAESKNAAGLVISEIRCGEGIFFGFNSSKGAEIKGLNRDVFKFSAEIIELQEKNIPEQKSDGLNALGSHSVPRPSGNRLCAVLDFGILVAPQADIFPEDPDIILAGQTFDFTVIDITESKCRYHAGDSVSFSVNYTSASFLCMNRFVEKCCI